MVHGRRCNRIVMNPSCRVWIARAKRAFFFLTIVRRSRCAAPYLVACCIVCKSEMRRVVRLVVVATNEQTIVNCMRAQVRALHEPSPIRTVRPWCHVLKYYSRKGESHRQKGNVSHLPCTAYCHEQPLDCDARKGDHTGRTPLPVLQQASWSCNLRL